MFRSRSAPRWLWRIFLAGTVLLVVLLALPATRERLLRAAGWALVAQDPLTPADVIVVSIDADGEGVLAAADLVHAGLATRVALFPDPPDRTDREFLRRGLPYSNRATIATMQLHALGVTSVELIPAPVSGTTAEGAALRQWCAGQGLRRVIFVSTPIIRGARAACWRAACVAPALRPAYATPPTPSSIRQLVADAAPGVVTEIVEAQKLLVDAVLRPSSCAPAPTTSGRDRLARPPELLNTRPWGFRDPGPRSLRPNMTGMPAFWSECTTGEPQHLALGGGAVDARRDELDVTPSARNCMVAMVARLE